MNGEPLRPAPVSFATALAYWARLGCVSFGGPAGQIALMHDELVVRRRWISERRFLHALNYCMVLPGPEAQQLATYMGWLMHRTAGGLAAGVLFVLPSFFVLVALAWLYVAYGSVPAVAAALYGVKPAVVAIVAFAAWRIGSRTLRSATHVAVAVAAFVALAVGEVPFPLIIAAAAIVGWIDGRIRPPAPTLHDAGAGAAPRAPAWIDDDTPLPPHARFSRRRLAFVVAAGLATGGAAYAGLVLAFGANSTPTAMAAFFTKAALLTFGGGYAVLPYVVQAAVEQHHWLSAAQMIDGLALGETTPGPLIMIVAFVGFLGGWSAALFGAESAAASAMFAAAVATAFTFLPSFVFIFAGAPLIETTHGRTGFTAPLAAIGAAVVGVIASLALFLAAPVLWPAGRLDAVAIAIGVAAGLALWRGASVIAVVIGGAALGGLLMLLPR